MRSVDLTPESLAAYDLVLLATDHDDFPYELIQQHAKLVVDTRGRYPSDTPNVVKA
jgi:UDP-N-acetyl-D-glucosamine dehydrogenase